ncbi:hypothetical protein [Paenibacillus nanensis]|nr:hypothetical protein [Paenibacillus nanensis]
MKYWVKLNLVSAAFALLPFLGTELLVNVYRISRLTGIPLGKVNSSVNMTIVVSSVLATILFVWVVCRILQGRLMSFFAVILWIPYYVLYVFLFALLFPIAERADDPNPATGLLLMSGLIVYPFYLAGILAVGTFRKWGRR